MPDSSPCITSDAPSGARGSILLAAMIVTLLVTMLVIGAAYEAGMRMETRQQLRGSTEALVYAQAGLENGARLTISSRTWGTDLGTGTWISAKPIGNGTVTVVATDPEDGMIEPDGSAGSSTADTVRLSSAATAANFTRSLVADYVPFPHEALRQVAYGRDYIGLQGVDVEGRLRSNGSVLDQGSGVLVRGDITTLTGETVSASLDDADTDVFFVSDSLTMPAVDFSWFQDAGEEVGLPMSGFFLNSVFTRDSNPNGSPSARAIYWIDAAGGDVYFYQVAAEACIVVLNANDVIVGSWLSQAYRYYHRSPDPDRLPALLVQGNLHMKIKADSLTFSMGGADTTVACGLEGVFYCTGELWGPQLYATDPIKVEGALLADELHLIGPGTLIRHDPDLNMNPLAELTQPGLRLVADSTREP
ncbi:MAG: hypothetical protein KAY24_12810 [Candidatus Eisenbacteria sp.]|nr:hypothetical protein [Candidatus Eisenbacteria bacterium]